ncbi:hypothetical protein CLV35_3352 [Motilibacter peucedani]|uniref:DUF559 domain-containing protein n=1 Tax=Motilibacter peucedani TaxID=598650 RepID=A0A420XL71_9ACTN|nr:hypothetical protein [Motilibacter peucedani]RKS69178.1 hypothetical protein CLV35_3352 [Motilibacter peucedani]
MRWSELRDAVGRSAVEWRLRRGDWQTPAKGVVVTHNGPLSTEQELWVDVVVGGRGAVLAGLTAASLAGLRGFDDSARRRWVLVPHGRKVTHARPGLVVRSSSMLGPEAVQAGTRPPRTRIARSLIDAVSWARSDRHAEALLLAGVQQRLVLPGALAVETARRSNFPRRSVAARAVAEAVGGAQTLSEAEFGRICRAAGLPAPDRQTRRLDASGRARWLDCEWARYGLVVEIDGRGHMDVRQWWADMLRDAHLVVEGKRVLRFPSFIVREEPDLVASLVASALELGGWSRPHASSARMPA